MVSSHVLRATRFAALIALWLIVAIGAPMVKAAPYAAMVMDARTGEILHSENADARLHPASLTKMMTLYVVFEAVENGEITLDTEIRISSKAAAEPPSKLGLRAGQSIRLRYLIRASAVRSANDAATALAEAISGSEAAFARRMNRTAEAMGMSRTTFKNAHGLTQSGHLSSARDMTILGRHVFYDYPQYYNLFSRTSTDAGLKTVSNTNRRLLADYRGADGIKTGFTNAAGFNLVASAERDGKRIIATVFGGRSTATRNARVAELLDLGFRTAPTRVAVRVPQRPAYAGNRIEHGVAGRVVRSVTAVAKSPRPIARPATSAIEEAVAVAVARLDASPVPRPEEMGAATDKGEPAPRVVSRLSSSGGRHWGINVGRYGSEYEAQRALLKAALMEVGTLEEALRKVVSKPGGFEANFVGMNSDAAELACRRLAVREIECSTFGPG